MACRLSRDLGTRERGNATQTPSPQQKQDKTGARETNVFSQNAFLDLDVKHREVKEKREDEFMGTLEKTAQDCGTASSPFLT